MNKRKCYLVVVTSAKKKNTPADCSTCCIPNSPHRHDMTPILHELSFITPSLTNFLGKRSTFACFWSLEPLLRYSMIFPLADQICIENAVD